MFYNAKRHHQALELQSPDNNHLLHSRLAQAIRYEAIDTPVNDFARTVADFIHGGGRGTNVTLPFKGQAAQLTKNTSVRVRIANTANTLVISHGQSIFAENTDGIGLLSDLKRLGLPLESAADHRRWWCLSRYLARFAA